jgi:hypothetical protein
MLGGRLASTYICFEAHVFILQILPTFRWRTVAQFLKLQDILQGVKESFTKKRFVIIRKGKKIAGSIFNG